VFSVVLSFVPDDISLYLTTGMCPKGDDPLTPSEDYRTIRISIATTAGALGGSFKFTFNGLSFSFPASWTKSACELAFSSLQNVDIVTCSITADPNANGRTNNNYITVNFLSFPANPYENNIVSNNGNPPLTAFGCDVSSATGTGPSCTITDVSGLSYPEYSYCSNRGICDFDSGTCTCYKSFFGTSCSTYAPVASAASAAVSSSDILALQTQQARM
jgi:hypothetical protein